MPFINQRDPGLRGVKGQYTFADPSVGLDTTEETESGASAEVSSNVPN